MDELLDVTLFSYSTPDTNDTNVRLFQVEVKFGERDLNGEYTLKHGDWVQFNIATDRRDRLKKATNITLLEQR